MLFSLVLLCSTTALFSQAHEGVVKYDSKLQPAAVLNLDYTEAIVTAALKDYLLRKGKSKAGDLKGFTTYRNTQATQNGTENADLYFKIERKSRKEKEQSVVYLLVTPLAGTTSALHSLTMEEAKTYLNELVFAIADYSLEQDISNQNKLVVTAEAKQKKLLSEAADLEKKKAATEQKIADNKLLQQAQDQEVQIQKEKLAAMVGRRRN